MTDSDKKIIIDEDWKSQVEREREEFEKQAEPKAATQGAGSGMPDDFPPASISLLVTSLATQAITSLGQLPDPMTGQTEANPALAKFNIDLLAVLREKTIGNLSEEETEMLDTTLHQLRMIFVQVNG